MGASWMNSRAQTPNTPQEHREETFTQTHEVGVEPLFKVLAQHGDAAAALSLMGPCIRENGLGTKELPSTWAQTAGDPCALGALSKATSVTPP